MPLPLSLASLAPILTTLFFALGLVLPGILKRDGFSDRLNQIIAFVVVVVASLATALVQSKLGPDFGQDFVIVMTLMHTLLGVDGPFKSLDQFLQSNVNAGAKPVQQFAWIRQAPYIQDPETTLKRPVVNPQEMYAVKPPAGSIGG